MSDINTVQVEISSAITFLEVRVDWGGKFFLSDAEVL